jgi:hypothetical protein
VPLLAEGQAEKCRVQVGQNARRILRKKGRGKQIALSSFLTGLKYVPDKLLLSGIK